MKYFFLLIGILALGAPTYAQESGEIPEDYDANLRVEVVLDKQSSENYYVLPTGEDGLVLFNMIDSIGENKKERIWAFTKFTTDFIKIWDREIPIPYRLIYERHYWDGLSLHVLLLHEKERQKRQFEIISLNAETGEIRSNGGVIPYNVKVNDFSVIRNLAYIGGETQMGKLEGYGRGLAAAFIVPIYMGVLNYDPNLVFTMVDTESGEKEKMDLDFFKSSSVQSLTPNPRARSMSTIISHTPSKWDSKVYVKEYAGDKLIRNLEVNPKGDNRLITARVMHLNRNEFMVVGTYSAAYYEQKFWKRLGAILTGQRLPLYAQGIYVAKFEYRGQKYIKYYNFAEFENFFEAYGKRYEKKVKKKKKKKEKKGKQLLLDFSLLLHDIVEANGEYLLVAESYKPEYRKESSYDPITGRFFSPREVFVGYRYTHAIVAGIDIKTGELKWDNSFPIWNILSFNLKERVQILVKEDEKGQPIETTLVYNNEGYLQSRTIEEGEVLEPKNIKAIQTEFASDRIRSDFNSDIEYWYDNYFLAWGYQKIKKTDEKVFSNKRNRQVFYFYKVGY